MSSQHPMNRLKPAWNIFPLQIAFDVLLQLNTNMGREELQGVMCSGLFRALSRCQPGDKTKQAHAISYLKQLLGVGMRKEKEKTKQNKTPKPSYKSWLISLGKPLRQPGVGKLS